LARSGSKALWTVCGCFDPGRRASGSPFWLKAWMALRVVCGLQPN
jgi:hypothetical protein